MNISVAERSGRPGDIRPGALRWWTALLVFAPACIAKTPTPTAAARSAVVHVPAESWSQFALEDHPEDLGWVALPEQPANSSSTYSSPVNPAALGLLGPEECRECHEDYVDGFLKTAHARTAQIANPLTILGKLTPPENRVQTHLKEFYFETLSANDQVVHRLHYPDQGDSKTLDVPLAFTIGSGNHGQSFLAWHGDLLCQTPLSFLTEANRWGNSPGVYLDGTADFSRPATSRCLDCHNTWIGHDATTINRYDKHHWILGVTCVRCHGPAREHVQYHRQFPDETEPHAIVNPRDLDLTRANEVCSQCHSGAGEQRRPAFTYRPGEPLEQWLTLNLDAHDASNDDPHAANQLGRLMRSRCYQVSGTLTCMDCHDLHQQERGNMAVFANRCQSCHQVSDCGLSPKYPGELGTRCIECHMPSRRDAHVTSQGAGGSVAPLLRDHLIGIWPQISNAVELDLNGSTR